MVATTSALTGVELAAPARRVGQRRAVFTNLGMGLFIVSIGSQGDDMLQLYATQVFGLGPGQLGTAVGLLVFTIPLQIAVLPLIERIGKARVLAAGYLLRVMLFAPFLLLPALFDRSHQLGFAAFAALLFAINAVHASSFHMAWPALMKDITVRGERGRFFASVRFWSGLTSFLLLSGVGLLVEDGMGAAEYRLLVTVGLLYLVWSWWHVRAIPEVPPRLAADQRRLGPAMRLVLADLVRLFRHARFRRFAGLAAMGAMAGIPMTIVYGQAEFGVTDQQASFYSASRYLVALFALLAWGPLIDRLGAGAAMRLGGLGVAGCIALLFLVPPSGALAFLAVALGITACGAGIAIAIHTEAYDSLGTAGAVVGLAAYSFVMDATEYGKRALAGWALENSSRVTGEIGPLHIDGYRLCLLVPLAVALTFAVCAGRLRPAGEAP